MIGTACPCSTDPHIVFSTYITIPSHRHTTTATPPPHRQRACPRSTDPHTVLSNHTTTPPHHHRHTTSSGWPGVLLKDPGARAGPVNSDATHAGVSLHNCHIALSIYTTATLPGRAGGASRLSSAPRQAKPSMLVQRHPFLDFFLLLSASESFFEGSFLDFLPVFANGTARSIWIGFPASCCAAEGNLDHLFRAPGGLKMDPGFFYT